MNIKSTLFLFITVISCSSIMNAMSPVDHAILNQVQSISYTRNNYGGGVREIWTAYLPNNKKIEIADYLNGELEGIRQSTMPLGAFATPESIDQAFTIIKQKYEMQSPSYGVTQ